MFWEEDEDKSIPYEVPDTVFDLSFAIQCKSLPIHHAWQLSEEILTHLPWMRDNKFAGIHQIHVAESNNGWLRPDEDDALLYPSRRTKLTLRIPSDTFEEASSLCGKTLNINSHAIKIGKSKKKPFSNSSVIFSRYILTHADEDENQFLTRIAREIKVKTNFNIKKMLCGKSHEIQTPEGKLPTRHLMIADLDSDTSIKIQQHGLGEGRILGCGLFLPHKGIKSLNPSD